MTTITCPDDDLYGFFEELHRASKEVVWPVLVDPEARTVSTTSGPLGVLLERAAAGKAFAWPVNRTKHVDRWIVTGADGADSGSAIARIERALVPSYAHFPTKSGVAVQSRFNPSSGLLHAHGAALYPDGYYAFQTRVADRATVLDRLDRWARLEASKPTLTDADVPSHAELMSRFHAATASNNWGDAASTLDELDRLGLSSAENSLFLRIELLARQGRWSDLWLDPDRPRTVRLRTPRGVRAALLTAYYEVVLNPAIAALGTAAALESYRADRPQLAELLTGGFGLEISSARIVKGFEEAIAGNSDRLAALAASSDDQVRAVLTELQSHIPAAAVPKPTSSPIEQLRAAMAEQDYDAALDHAGDLPDLTGRIAARIEIAALSGDPPLCTDVLRAYAELAPTQVLLLEEAFPTFRPLLERVAEAAGRPAPDIAPPPSAWMVEDWPSWFDAVLATPDQPELAHEALDRIDGSLEQRFSDAKAAHIADAVSSLYINGRHTSDRVVREGIRRLVRALIAESGFPREGLGANELYIACLDAYVETEHRNADSLLTVHALAVARLDRDSSAINQLIDRLSAWFEPAVPALEPRVLDLIELLIDHGALPGQVRGAVRAWIDMMANRPIHWDETRMRVWRAVAQWADAGVDVLDTLSKRLAAERADDELDAIAQLPATFQIAIFSLNERSAERAALLLRERNPKLTVAICSDKVLTERAKQLARASDASIIVTRCNKHALTEGIRPYLNDDPIYPPSVGATGIVQAVVAWAEQWESQQTVAA